MGDTLSAFMMGANTVGFLAAGVFFLRFWRRTRDGLFIAFSTAFFLLAANQALVALSGIPREEQSPIYLLRLAAFSLLIIAIVRKNMTSRSTRR
jgi:hypothetical protein